MMLTNRPRIVLVGATGYGSCYLQELMSKDTGADLVGVCDIQDNLYEKVPVLKERGIPVYRTLDEFFAVDHADLAIIVSPVHFHTEMSLNCFAHGTHVLCEKPLCLTLEEAERMAEGSRKSGKFLAVGYQLNYRRDVLALKKDILDGRYGKPVRLSLYHGYRRGPRYYARNNWAGKVSVNGREVFDSPFANACAHNFQMMTFLLGDSLRTACDVTALDAEIYRGNPDVENFDIAAMRFTTDGGVPIHYYTCHPMKTPCFGPKGVFEFEKGTITFDSENPSFKAVMADGEVIDYTTIDPGVGIMQKLYDALDCIRNGSEPVCTVSADLAHIRAVRMVQEQPVRPVRAELRHIEELDGEPFVIVDNLEEIIRKSAEAWKLPTEAGFKLD